MVDLQWVTLFIDVMTEYTAPSSLILPMITVSQKNVLIVGIVRKKEKKMLMYFPWKLLMYHHELVFNLDSWKNNDY